MLNCLPFRMSSAYLIMPGQAWPVFHLICFLEEGHVLIDGCPGSFTRSCLQAVHITLHESLCHASFVSSLYGESTHRGMMTSPHWCLSPPLLT